MSSPRLVTFIGTRPREGRTTVVLSLACALARRGQRILVVDLGPGAHASLAMLGPEVWLDRAAKGALIDEAFVDYLRGQTIRSLRSAVTQATRAPNGTPTSLLSVLPSSPRVADLLSSLALRRPGHFFDDNPTRVLFAATAGIFNAFDAILVDLPAGCDIRHLNALRLGGELILTSGQDPLALWGAGDLLAQVGAFLERSGTAKLPCAQLSTRVSGSAPPSGATLHLPLAQEARRLPPPLPVVFPEAPSHEIPTDPSPILPTAWLHPIVQAAGERLAAQLRRGPIVAS